MTKRPPLAHSESRLRTRDAGVAAARGKCPESSEALYGPLGGILAMVRCWRIRMSPFGQPGRTLRHPSALSWSLPIQT